MKRTLWSLAALAMLAAIVAGCGNGSAGSGKSTAASGATSTAAPVGTGNSSNSTAGIRERAVKFAACMRENGYANFPDPKASGEFPNFGISVSPEVWTSALDACKELQPPGSFSGHRTPEQQATALKFAQCIREHGVKDFPDPVNGDPVIDTTKIPSTEKPGGMTILHAAMAKCSGRASAEEGAGG